MPNQIFVHGFFPFMIWWAYGDSINLGLSLAIDKYHLFVGLFCNISGFDGSGLKKTTVYLVLGLGLVAFGLTIETNFGCKEVYWLFLFTFMNKAVLHWEGSNLQNLLRGIIGKCLDYLSLHYQHRKLDLYPSMKGPQDIRLVNLLRLCFKILLWFHIHRRTMNFLVDIEMQKPKCKV